MNRRIKIALLLFLSVGCYIVYYATPKGERRTDLFWLVKEEITLQSHVYYACEHVSRMCLLAALFYALPRFRYSMRILFALEFITLIDYLARYNKDFIPGYDIVSVKIVVYTVCMAVEIGRIIYATYYHAFKK